MFYKSLKKAVEGEKIKWQRHALERMMEREIFRNDVKKVLLEGELVEEYEDDHPLPGGLFLGIVEETPLHVVAAVDAKAGFCYIVTAYRPDSDHFEPDHKTRKK